METILQQLILQALEQGINTEKELQKLKNQFSEKYRVPSFSKQEINSVYQKLVQTKKIKPNPKFSKLLQKRAIRTLSGVAPVAVLTRPYPCPGKCVYCPTEPDIPKSYLANEPAVMRAILNDFDPFRQVQSRLKALQASGHATDKVELIVMGGTFNYHPKQYQTNFIRQCLNALNCTSKPSRSLTQAQKLNETAKNRCIGITLETRPDFITPKELQRFRELGGTRVEIGVQTIDDKILKLVKRGHLTAQTIQATRLMKNFGFKICYHLMPNLPGSTPQKDFKAFQEIFANPDFRPDLIKIYPCVVTPHSELEKWWKKGKYKPYSKQQLTNLILKIKKIIPPYVRIIRVIRDIPADNIIAGNTTSNLRQIIQEHPDFQCQCIRCREIKNRPVNIKNLKLITREYEASGGLEYFLSFEDVKQNKLCSLLRLRIPSFIHADSAPSNSKLKPRYTVSSNHTIPNPPPPELKNCSIIREVHTYGLQLKIGDRRQQIPQHLGLGKKLIKAAEKITRQHGLQKIAVISGIGAREYYRKLGYRLIGTYMIKKMRAHPAERDELIY